MAQIILVYPITGLDVPGVSLWLPLSVLHVAATLVRDYDVQIIDQRVDPAWRRTLRRAIDEDTLCVGVSSMTGAQIRCGLEAAAVVRDAAPRLPIVWGGNHPTLVPQQTARHPLVDVVVMGEGEATFRTFVDLLAQGRDWRACPNIAYKDGDDVRVQGDSYDFVDANALPGLPYHLVDVERYARGRLLFGRPLRSLPFVSSFGCPYSCSFCCQPVLSNRRWRRMKPEAVVERVFALADRYDLDAVEFHDEEFFVDRRRGARIAEALGGRLRWYAQTRMDDLLSLDLDLLERCGLSSVQPGLESGSDRILQLVRKEETVADYRRANRALAGTGILTTYNFMMGFPTETVDELCQTVDLALELLETNANARVSGFYAYVPYPGSELYQLAVKLGFHEPAAFEGWQHFSRQQVAAPWAADRQAMRFLLHTSKLIDGKRLASAGAPRAVAARVGRYFSRRYQELWRRHDFEMKWDIRLWNLASQALR